MRRARSARLPAAVLAVVLACAWLAATAAQAKRVLGVVPDVASARDVATRAHGTPPRRAHLASLPYGGGPVLHWNRTHLIFWQPAGSGLVFDAGYVPLIETFMRHVAADSHKTTNVYSLSGQYYDGSGRAAYASAYGGAVVDTDRLPGNGCHEPLLTGPGWGTCLTDDQLEHELGHVIAVHHLPTTQHDVYFLITPRGFGSCEDATSSSCALGGSGSGYCGYHFSTPQNVLYAVIPYNAVVGHCQSDNPRPNANAADPAISTISHEHNEMVTDPLGDAWLDAAGNEDGDICLQYFGPNIGGFGSRAWNEAIGGGHYYLQEEYSNFDSGCVARARPDSVSFRGREHVGRGKRVSFTAHGSAPTGAIRRFTWFFGDGRTGRGRTVTHRWGRAGAFHVVVRGIDSWDNYAYAERVVRVSG